VRLRGDDRLDQSVIADANLDTALVELLQYGIDERTGPSRTVTLTVGDRSTGTARVDVEYPDGRVPPRDRRVLDRGLETQLEHCRGLGLWLAKWIVGHAHGRLRFPEDDADLRVELRRAGG
jgi:sensor histidine kinase regulating citrate/malate metabolism